MNDRWMDLLSPYLDGELTTADRRDLEAHLETCADCAAALASLRDLVSRARRMRELDAAADFETDLWPGIESRIRDLPVSTVRPLPRTRARRAAGKWNWISFPGLAVAAAALLAVSSFAFYNLGWDEGFKRGGLASGGRAPVVQASADAALVDAATADVVRLKQSLVRHRDRIDRDTYRALDESLGGVESAVGDATRALAADPGNPYIQAHLEELRTRQLELLRRAVTLAEATP